MQTIAKRISHLTAVLPCGGIAGGRGEQVHTAQVICHEAEEGLREG